MKNKEIIQSLGISIALAGAYVEKIQPLLDEIHTILKAKDQEKLDLIESVPMVNNEIWI